MYLSKELYLKDFVITRNNMKQFMKKFEYLQSYDFLNEKTYINYLKNDKNEYISLLTNFALNDLKNAADDNQYKIEIQRLRYIKHPLTKYLEHQYYIYKILNKNGRETKYFTNDNLLMIGAKDFICFENVCYILDFSDSDLLGAYKIIDKKVITQIKNWYDMTNNLSKPTNLYMEPNSSIMDALLEKNLI